MLCVSLGAGHLLDIQIKSRNDELFFLISYVVYDSMCVQFHVYAVELETKSIEVSIHGARILGRM